MKSLYVVFDACTRSLYTEEYGGKLNATRLHIVMCLSIFARIIFKSRTVLTFLLLFFSALNIKAIKCSNIFLPE